MSVFRSMAWMIPAALALAAEKALAQVAFEAPDCQTSGAGAGHQSNESRPRRRANSRTGVSPVLSMPDDVRRHRAPWISVLRSQRGLSCS